MSPLRNEIQTFVSALPISNHDMSSPPSSVQPTFQKIKTLFSTTYFPFKLEKYATATDTSSENRKTGSLMPAPTKSNASPAVNSSPEETSGSSGSLSSATSTSDTLAIVQGMEMFGPTPSPSTLPWAIVSKTQEPETGFTSLTRTTTTPEMSSPSRRATASAYASPSIAPLDAETRPLLGNATVAQTIVSVSPIRDLSSSPRYVQPASPESNTSATLQVPSSLLPSSTFQASKKYNADLRSTRQLRSTTPNLSVTAYSLSETGSTSTGISSESANKKTVPGLLTPAATTPVKATSTSDAFAVVQGLEIFGLLQVRMSTIVLGVPSSTTETVYTLPPPFETVHIVVPPGVWPSSGGRRAGTGPPLSVSVFVLPSDRNVLPASSCGPAVGLGPIGTRLSGQLLVSVPCGGLPPRGLSPAGFAFDKASGNWTPVALKSGPGYNGSNSTAWAQTPVVGPIAAGWVPNQISSVEQSSDGPSDQGVVIGSVLGAVSFVLVSVAIATAGRRMQSQCVEGQSVVQFSKRPTGDKFIPTSPDKSVMGEENDRKEEESQRLQHTSSSWTPENPTAKYIDERCSSEIDLDRSLVLRLSFDQMEICSEISSSRSSADLDAGPQRSLAQLCRADTVTDITGSCPGGPDIQQAGMTKDVSNCGRSGSDLGVPKDHTATRKQEPVPEWGSCTAAYKDGAGFREGFVSIRVAHPDASDAKVAQMQPSAKAASSGGKQRQDNEVVAGAQGAASELWGLWGDWEALESVRDTETAIKRLSSHRDNRVQRRVFTEPEATATRMHKVNSEAAVLRVFGVDHKETDSARQRSTCITDGPEKGGRPARAASLAETEAVARGGERHGDLLFSRFWTPGGPEHVDQRRSSETATLFDQMEICSEISSSSSADLDAGPQRSLAQLCRADTVTDITGSCPGGPDIQQAGMTKDVSNCGRSGSDLGVPKDHTATRKQEPVPEWGSCTAAYKDGAGFREGFVSIRVAHPDASDAKVAQMQPSAKAASSGGKQRQDNEVVAGAQGAASELWGLWGDWEALVSVRDTETAIKRLSSHQDDGVQRSVFTVPEATATRMHKVNSEAAVLRVFQVNHKETDSARQRSTRITDGPETGTLPAVNIRCAAGQTEAAAPKTNAGSKVSSACTRDPYLDDDASRTECEVLPGVHSAPSPALEVLLSGVSEAFKLSTASPDQLAAVKGKIAQGEKRQMSQLSSSFRTPGGSEYVDQLQRRSSETETLRVFDQMEICSELFSSRSSPGSDLETGPFRVDNEEVNSAWQRSTQITAGPEKGGLLAVSIQGAAVETEATAPKTNAAPRAISAGTRDLGLDDARRTAGEMLPGVYGDASLKVLRSGDSEALSAASPDQPELAAVKEKLVRGGEIHRGLLFSRFRTPGGPEYVDQRRSSETATLFDQMEICSEISSSRSSIG